MEIFDIARNIEKKINQLEELRAKLWERSKAKAEAVSNYDKALAVKILQIKETQPASLCEKLAKGELDKERYEMELADAYYRSLNTAINCIMAELNGWQSVYRHLSEN